MLKYDHLEIARIIGEPKDPRKPYPDLVSSVCNVEGADPDEYLYYFDVIQDTDKIYVITTGGVTQEDVVPDTPAAVSFVDIVSPEYYVKITALASAKERTLARKVATINRALNAEENYRVLSAIDTAAVAQGNTVQLSSGELSFNYKHLIEMIDQVIDYSTNYTLVMGTQIDKDLKLWNWTDDKNQSLTEAFARLGVDTIRVNETVTRDAVSTSVLDSNTAYLVGKNTEEPGKPVLFVRKRMNDIERLGGVIYENGDKPDRLVFVSPNPIQVSSTRYLAVGITGYEELACVVTNPYALSKFTRAT